MSEIRPEDDTQNNLANSQEVARNQRIFSKARQRYQDYLKKQQHISEEVGELLDGLTSSKTAEEPDEEPSVQQVIPKEIEEFIDTIPHPDRQLAIEQAKGLQERFVAKIWNDERNKLDAELLLTHNLTPDLQGWGKYLQLAFENDNREYFKRFGVEDWSKKYLADMLYFLADDEYNAQFGAPPKLGVGFYNHYLRAGINPEIWGSIPKNLNPNSLLVHSISETSLMNAIKSGVVGQRGKAAVAFCQDRVVFDRGYIIAYQVSELLEAGYPLLRVNEDPRDAKVLREWRSPIPVDINLARLAIPTSIIPDRKNASRAQIATTYFGEEYLRQIPRLN